MNRIAALLVVLLLGLSPALSTKEVDEVAKTDADLIKQAVTDYVGGYFASDPSRLEKALHPNLAKFIVKKVPNAETEYLDQMGAASLIAFTKHNQAWVKGKKIRTMKIVYQDQKIAVVHAVSDDFYDVCTLVKINGEWKVLTVVWDMN